MASLQQISAPADSRLADGTPLGVARPEPKYWAFISYSHRNARIAAGLQRAIETYRLPRRLVGTRTAVGVVPARLKPVFLDRDELQAGTDLQTIVREALAQSRYLIVVCSPDAARSPWVNQEVIEFKKLHGESRVLAVIAAGEPFASRMEGREREECFPPALRAEVTSSGFADGPALEPIAADLRPHADGPRRGTLKLIAGMIGVGADELLRRDAKRRIRQLAIVTAGSLAGMAAMGVLAFSAVRARDEARTQRNEAQVQRGEAEDLIEFMLGDLRKKLDNVGRLDVLDGVGEKALAYYARQDPNRFDASALGRRARALHLIGEMREQRGQLEAAQSAFQRAADMTGQLLARAPRDGQRIFEHAQSIYWVGHLARLRGRIGEAEDAFRKYLRFADDLVRLDGRNATWQVEAAYARQNVAVICLETARNEEALTHLLEGRDIWLRLANPAHAFAFSNTIGSIAKAYEAQNDFERAIAAQKEKMQVLQAMPDAGKNQRVRRAFFTINGELARLELAIGHPKNAQEFAQSAVQTAAELARLDPQNKVWLEQHYIALADLAEAKMATGDRPGAWEHARSVLAGSAKLVSLDPKMAKWQVELRGRALAIAAELARDEERPTLTQELQAYLAAVKQFYTEGGGATRVRDLLVARAELQLGMLLRGNGAAEEAAHHFRAVVARLQSYAESHDFLAVTVLATARARLGDLTEARSLAQRIEASPFRHPAFADLQQLLAKGAGPLAQKP